MNVIGTVSLITGIVAVAAALLTVFLYRRRTVKVMGRLSDMITAAVDGTFTESTYDESRISAMEAKFHQYLMESATSSRNLKLEKDKIKALISDISHQTKTPIANILLYLQLLLERPLPEEEGNYIRQTYLQAEKLSFLIDALVKISRLETGIIALDPKCNAAEDLLKAVEMQIRPLANKKAITLHFEPIGESAVFDKKWTEEALYNILDNAVKYTACGGHIEVTAVPYELFLRIDIKDNGIGICEKELEKIFGRFYRSGKVSSYEGVGIGLFLTREIITSEGGYIKVYSKEGEGSTFSVFLPM